MRGIDGYKFGLPSLRVAVVTIINTEQHAWINFCLSFLVIVMQFLLWKLYKNKFDHCFAKQSISNPTSDYRCNIPTWYQSLLFSLFWTEPRSLTVTIKTILTSMVIIVKPNIHRRNMTGCGRLVVHVWISASVVIVGPWIFAQFHRNFCILGVYAMWC